MLGVGSQSSPILISDDEDEDMQHPRQMANTSLSKQNHIAFRQGLPGLPPRPAVAPKSGQNVTQRVQNSGNGNLNSNDVSRRPKRKRETSQQSLEITVSSSVTSPASGSAPNAMQNGAKSKKPKLQSHRGRAAARRRMAKESELANQAQSIPGPPAFDPGFPLLYPYSFDTYHQDGQETGYGSNLPEHDHHSSSPYPDDAEMCERTFSSDWVNSMARAADRSSPELEPSSWDSNPTFSWPLQTHDPGPSHTFDFSLAPVHPPPPPPPLPATLPLPVPPPPPLPPPPSVLAIPTPAVPSNSNADNKTTVTSAPAVLRKLIGMPSDRDPDGKRSGFKISSNTIFQSQPHVAYPHTPTRSNTIIMEQLPKQNRDPEFIMSWGEKAAGSAPIFLAVDPSSAKALVEFSSHALARKAWSSPKLGKHLAGLPSTDLKGKAREDLIRVWWYKPSSPDLVFIRLELEEGEIEDETTSDPSVKKETKKERKARLAKLAREEKEKRKEVAIHAAVLLEQEKLAARKNANAAVESTAPVLPSFAALPAPPQLLPPASYSYTTLPTSWANHHGNYHLPQALQQQETPKSLTPSQVQVGPGESRNTLTTHEDDDEEVMSIDEGDLFDVPTAISFDPLDPKLDPSHSSPSVTSMPSRLVSEMKPSPADVPPVTSPPIPYLTAPSEPRAMKNAPKAPTFTKRALLVRQKELEARIARSKLELLRRMERRQEAQANSSVFGDIQQPHQESNSSSSPAEEKLNEPSIPAPIKDTASFTSPKLIRENHLRNLVLASRRQKAVAVDGSDDAPAKVVTALPPDSKIDTGFAVKAVVENASVPGTSTTSSVDGARYPVVQTSLDDLAASFIAETIQTLKPVSGQNLPPLATSQVANYKPSQPSPPPAILAARQKELEDQIAESKRLMEKLMRATTKQEKDSIMASIRGLSRSPNVNGNVSSPQTPSLPAPAAPKLPLVPSPSTVKPVQTIDLKCVWPAESLPEGGVFILSDDDEDE